MCNMRIIGARSAFDSFVGFFFNGIFGIFFLHYLVKVIMLVSMTNF